jgi:hypothetical protein
VISTARRTRRAILFHREQRRVVHDPPAHHATGFVLIGREDADAMIRVDGSGIDVT